MEIKNIVFGPVLSRRLGYSLGIDLLPSKTCNLDCVYCEVCKTNKHTNDRIDYTDFDQVINEIKNVNHEIDYLTITGSGEPTLHKHLDVLVKKLKKNFEYPIVLITNSVLLSDELLRKELSEIDVIMPSLDAVSPDVFEKINKPVEGILISDIIQGLIDLRTEFLGSIWLEILFCKGLNDSRDEVAKMRDVIKKINPDKVQLNTVVRPPAYTDSGALSYRDLQQIAEELDIENTEILLPSKNKKSGVNLSKEDLLNYLKRRPANFEEINQCFGEKTADVRSMLLKLQESQDICKYNHNNEVFYKVTHPPIPSLEKEGE